MASSCDICGRGPLNGHSRSHSNIATNRLQNLNLQHKTIGKTKQWVCTRCLKTLAKNKAIKTRSENQVTFSS